VPRKGYSHKRLTAWVETQRRSSRATAPLSHLNRTA